MDSLYLVNGYQTLYVQFSFVDYHGNIMHTKIKKMQVESGALILKSAWWNFGIFESHFL